MITVDWGNYEETIIVLRVDETCIESDYRLSSMKFHAMMSPSLSTVDLILDIRMVGGLLAKLVRFLNYVVENREPNLNKIVVLGTREQERTMQLIANFYPKMVREIIVVDSVDVAYQLVSVA